MPPNSPPAEPRANWRVGVSLAGRRNPFARHQSVYAARRRCSKATTRPRCRRPACLVARRALGVNWVLVPGACDSWFSTSSTGCLSGVWRTGSRFCQLFSRRARSPSFVSGQTFACPLHLGGRCLWSAAKAANSPTNCWVLAALAAACNSRTAAGTSARDGCFRNTAKSMAASSLVPRHGACMRAPLPNRIHARHEVFLGCWCTPPSSDTGFSIGCLVSSVLGGCGAQVASAGDI